MTYEQYQEWRNQTEELQKLAQEYAELYIKKFRIGGQAHELTICIAANEYLEYSISVKWHWSGAYGAEDEDWIIIPTKILFGNKQDWEDNIRKEYEASEYAKELEKKRKEENRVKTEIRGAKAILEKYGIKVEE